MGFGIGLWVMGCGVWLRVSGFGFEDYGLRSMVQESTVGGLGLRVDTCSVRRAQARRRLPFSRCQANMAHTRKLRTCSGLGFQIKVADLIECLPRRLHLPN